MRWNEFVVEWLFGLMIDVVFIASRTVLASYK